MDRISVNPDGGVLTLEVKSEGKKARRIEVPYSAFIKIETQAQKETAIAASLVSYKSNASATDRENAIKNAVTTTTEGVEITNKEITGDIPTDYTDGQPVNVAVTVTYKDGSIKVVEVPVTVTQTDAQKYDPTVNAGPVSVNKDNVTTPEQKETLKTDILNKVTVPAEAGNVTKEVQGDIPTTVGSHQIPVKVTYADGTFDMVKVEFNITEALVTPKNQGTMSEEKGNPGEVSTKTPEVGKKDVNEMANKGNQLPKTGDVTNVGIYGGLVVLSATGLLAVLTRRRKEEDPSKE